jgi:hypothetical protein
MEYAHKLSSSSIKRPSSNYGSNFSRFRYDIGNHDDIILDLIANKIFNKTLKSLINEEIFFLQGLAFELQKNKSIGYPSPEGIHQDGHHIVVQHMIKKFNITGGKSLIYNLNKENIATISLENFLDSCYIKDKMVMHNVSPIRSI